MTRVKFLIHEDGDIQTGITEDLVIAWEQTRNGMRWVCRNTTEQMSLVFTGTSTTRTGAVLKWLAHRLSVPEGRQDE